MRTAVAIAVGGTFGLWGEGCGTLQEGSQSIEVCLQGGGELKLHFHQTLLAQKRGPVQVRETPLAFKLQDLNLSKGIVVIDQSRLLKMKR